MEPVRSVARAAAIVDVVAGRSPEGARLIDVVEATALQKTTAHRILATLVGLEWLEHSAESGVFHLGPKLVGLGGEALNRHGIAEIASPRLTSLSRLTEDTVFLSVPSGTEALCVDRVLGSFPIRTLTLQVGDRRPLGIGAGAMALLAWQRDADIDLALATPSSSHQYQMTDMASMKRSIQITRERGYSINDGGIVPGAVGVGVPVLNSDDTAVAALSIGAIASRMTTDRMNTLAELMRTEATLLADDLRSVAQRLSPPSIRRLLPPLT
ncbi:MAG TPA: IclR family transcriptional regulator [Candidatus Agrococcus pullicola]|uniref:IclR family transcriptional regulator n=1 Tax=Candidatus Agrococcus pullicola TaxID=2838429 RepID=A0A9D2C9Z1_9MICO|nr:IclR family transcriptional regulator [Candidatus Agrococcus pullicola]